LVIQNPDLKVILMSAYADIEYNKSFQFISKPIQITHLLEIVKDNLNKYQRPIHKV
jgi:DNA-binding NtrC family response regulator